MSGVGAFTTDIVVIFLASNFLFWNFELIYSFLFFAALSEIFSWNAFLRDQKSKGRVLQKKCLQSKNPWLSNPWKIRNKTIYGINRSLLIHVFYYFDKKKSFLFDFLNL